MHLFQLKGIFAAALTRGMKREEGKEHALSAVEGGKNLTGHSENRC
jgi:hypothetical protein